MTFWWRCGVLGVIVIVVPIVVVVVVLVVVVVVVIACYSSSSSALPLWAQGRVNRSGQGKRREYEEVAN